MSNLSCSPISPPLSDAPGNKKVLEVSTVVSGPALFVSSPGIVSHSLCMRTWLGSFGLLQLDGHTRQFSAHRLLVRRHCELLTGEMGFKVLNPCIEHSWSPSGVTLGYYWLLRMVHDTGPVETSHLPLILNLQSEYDFLSRNEQIATPHHLLLPQHIIPSHTEDKIWIATVMPWSQKSSTVWPW